MRSRRARRRGTCSAWRASGERMDQDSAPCRSRETTSIWTNCSRERSEKEELVSRVLARKTPVFANRARWRASGFMETEESVSREPR
eukprot:5783510-Prorocentrum_lima.AAC.1